VSDELNQALVTLALAVISAATLAITAFLVPWLRAKIGASKLNTAMALAENVVKQIEQTEEGKASEVKLRSALDALDHAAQRKGINLTAEERRTLVEAAVHSLRVTWAAVDAPPLPALTPANRRTTPRKAAPKAPRTRPAKESTV
jgi:hypothetical protein